MNELFPHRRWLVIPTSITGSINYDQVLEYSSEHLRVSVDGTKSFVKYDVTEVTSSYTTSYLEAETGETKEYTVEAGVHGRPTIYSEDYQEYTYEEILALMATSEWTNPRTI